MTRDFAEIRFAFFLAAPQIIKAFALGFDMRQVGPIQIADRQLPEDIVKDRRRVFDAVIALNHAGRFKPGEGKGLDKFIQRHAVLQANLHGDGEVIHHRAEPGAFLMHVDENFADLAVFIFAGPQIDFVPANDRLLGIALATLRKL